MSYHVEQWLNALQSCFYLSAQQWHLALQADAAASPRQRRWRVGASLLARGNLCAAQQLLVKGLFKHDTRLQTVQVSCWSLHLPAH